MCNFSYKLEEYYNKDEECSTNLNIKGGFEKYKNTIKLKLLKENKKIDFLKFVKFVDLGDYGPLLFIDN